MTVAKDTIDLNEPEWISHDSQHHEIYADLLAYIAEAKKQLEKVRELTESATSRLRSAGTEDASASQYRNGSRVVFAILFEIMKQLDKHSAQQDSLVTLVLTLRRAPISSSVVDELKRVDPGSLDLNTNHDLRGMTNVWTGLDRDAPIHPRMDDRSGYSEASSERPPWGQARRRYLTSSAWANVNHSSPDCTLRRPTLCTLTYVVCLL